MSNDDVIVFKDSVRHLCLYIAEVQHMAEVLEKGGRISRKRLIYALSCIGSYRKFTLRVMERMGIDDGLSFLEDNEFDGFSVKHGRIYADDRGKVLVVCRKWMEGFPDTANWYQFAAAMYALCLANAETESLIGELYPQYVLDDIDRVAAKAAA